MKTRRIGLAREIIVYPTVEPTEQFLDVLPMVTGEFRHLCVGVDTISTESANTCPKIPRATWTGKRQREPGR